MERFPLKKHLPTTKGTAALWKPMKCGYSGSYSGIKILNFIVLNFEVQDTGFRKLNFIV